LLKNAMPMQGEYYFAPEKGLLWIASINNKTIVGAHSYIYG